MSEILLLAILAVVVFAVFLTLCAAHLLRPVEDGREWRR
jgi:hypothetical protein